MLTRILRALVAAAGVAMVAAAGVMLLGWRHADAAAQGYLDFALHPTPRGRRLRQRHRRHRARDRHRSRPGRRDQGVGPDRPGRSDRDLLRDRGVAAGGVGLLALVLAAPTRLTRLSRRRLAEVLADRHLRLAMLGFTAVQMLDVATSIAGRHRLLYEGIALTRAVVARWGDAGFLMVKVPALLAVAVLAARLPRRWALIPVLAAAAPVALVVGGNLRLLAG